MSQSWVAMTWTSGEICTEEKMDTLALRDIALKDLIMDSSDGHTHDGEDSPQIAAADEDVRGSIYHWFDEKNISASGSATFYLSDDKTSSGDGIFTKVPFVIVLRKESNDWDTRHLGHTAAGSDNYYSVMTYDSGNGYWEIIVYNKDSGSAHDFRVCAGGV